MTRFTGARFFENTIFRLVLPLITLPILSAQILMLQSLPLLSTRSALQTTTVDYVMTSTLLSNPERGLYHHTETHANNYTPLEAATLQTYRQNEKITLILRLFYLEDFVNSDISPAYLAAMQADFDTVRQAGLKMIVRFAYTDQLPATPPYGDATQEQIEKHLDQLRPLLQANSDVIAVVQAGFIGVWGEWYYTDHCADDACRGQVLAALLDVLPAASMVQLRTPQYKYNIYSDTVIYSDTIPFPTPLALTQAHDGSNVARTGHHNDCFLSSASDYGTYIYTPTEVPYLEAETKYVVMGGETCDPSFATDPDPDRLTCETALAELERLHWSYLNLDWYPPTLQGWQDNGCFGDIERRLGYRLTLIQGVYPDEVQPGGVFSIDLKLRNAGWAAPFKPRPVELLLRHQSSGQIYRVNLPDDPRFWLPEEGIISLKHTICTPTGLPPGQYELLLNLPDPEPSLSSLPAYSIQLTNELVWEESTGYNQLLHTLTVTGPARHPVLNSSTTLAVCDEGVYLPVILKS